MAHSRVIAWRRVENSLDIKGICQGFNFSTSVRVLNRSLLQMEGHWMLTHPGSEELILLSKSFAPCCWNFQGP